MILNNALNRINSFFLVITLFSIFLGLLYTFFGLFINILGVNCLLHISEIFQTKSETVKYVHILYNIWLVLFVTRVIGLHVMSNSHL